MVNVCMITYNHESFIAEAIEGVLMQKTNFDFKLIISEDFSTDRTLEICKEYKEKYPERLELITSDKNIGMIPNFIRAINSCTGKYIALCEGDDYWTDQYKLQKQVDFLETNTNFVLIHTNKSVLGNGILYTDNSMAIKSGFIFEDLMFSPWICTLTVLAKTDILKESLARISKVIENRKWLMGDFPLWLDIAKTHQIAYINDVTGVYRFLDESASHSKNKNKSYQFDRSVISIKEHFFAYYISSKEKLSFTFKLRFYEMIFHAKKRLVLDYGRLARNEFFSLIFINPFLYLYFIFTKIYRILKIKALL